MFNCPLEELREYEDLKTLLDKGQGPLLLSGCIDSEKVHIAGRLAEGAPLRLWVTYNDAKAAEIAEDAACFGEDALVYPAKDLDEINWTPSALTVTRKDETKQTVPLTNLSYVMQHQPKQ